MQETYKVPAVRLSLIPAKQEPNCAWCGPVEPDQTSKICKPHEIIESVKVILRCLERRNSRKLIA